MAKSNRVRRDLRVSQSLADWVESLPPRYGENFSEKARALLEIAREYIEAEEEALRSMQLPQRKRKVE